MSFGKEIKFLVIRKAGVSVQKRAGLAVYSQPTLEVSSSCNLALILL